ncbi:potassium transporter TrkA [Candidatus Bathyarchaeota archaeon]|nr:potassium transporter TrkA [Candidatus Bathyarchaeota archaeon]
MKFCVIGLGEIGFVAAKYISDKGLDVWGYDISLAAVKRAKEAGITNAVSSWNDLPLADVYLICVYSGLKDEVPNLSPIFDVCEKIKRTIKSSDHPLVSIESTIVPGLCRKIFQDIFEDRVRLVHVPHRYWREKPTKHGVKQLRVIGGVNAESLQAGLKLYSDVLGIPLHIVSSIEVAEMSKIAENAYRYIQIAFAEELRMICEGVGLKFDEVRDACNTKWNIAILEARDGIGGHCLQKDAKYLASLTKFKSLIESALHIDEQYRKWLKHRS